MFPHAAISQTYVSLLLQFSLDLYHYRLHFMARGYGYRTSCRETVLNFADTLPQTEFVDTEVKSFYNYRNLVGIC